MIHFTEMKSPSVLFVHYEWCGCRLRRLITRMITKNHVISLRDESLSRKFSAKIVKSETTQQSNYDIVYNYPGCIM